MSEAPISPGTDFGILRELDRWVGWREETRNGKKTKVPFMPGTGRNASSTDPGTWGSHDAARNMKGVDGAGFVLSGHPNLVALDLDGAIDPETKQPRPWAVAIVAECDSYTELSPSENGLHTWGTAEGLTFEPFTVYITPDREQKIEVFFRNGRYVTVTDKPFNGEAKPLADISHVVCRLHAEQQGAGTSNGTSNGNGGAGAHTTDDVLLDDLSPEVVNLIKNGAEVGDRSEPLYRVVCEMREKNRSRKHIIATLRAYPGGIVQKGFDNGKDKVEYHVGLILEKLHDKWAKERAEAGQETGAKAQSGPSLIFATPYIWRDPQTIPRREWIYGRIVRRFLTCKVATGATGKSALSVGEVLAITSGRDLLKRKQPRLPMRVWYWNLEDPKDEIDRRIQAAALHYKLGPDDIGDRLFVNNGREQPCILTETTRSGIIICRPVVDKLVQEIISKQIDVLIIDPFISCHRVPENDNSLIDMVAKELVHVADEANCGVDVVHHTRKQGGEENTAESARGAKALIDASRSALVLNRMTQAEGAKAGVDIPRLYFRGYDDKPNLVPSAEDCDWYRLVSVELGNGDRIGVCEAWEMPDAMEGMSANDLLNVQRAIRLSGKRWRKHASSPEWVGRIIAETLKLNIDKERDRARVNELLKLWLNSGALKSVVEEDEHRHRKEYVEVGEWADE